MIELINKTKDGQLTKFLSIPFKNSKLIKIKHDNMTFVHAYDDVEEFCIFYEKNYTNCDEYYILYNIYENRIKDIELIQTQNYKELEKYKDYFILLNDLITVEKFLEMTDV